MSKTPVCDCESLRFIRLICEDLNPCRLITDNTTLMHIYEQDMISHLGVDWLKAILWRLTLDYELYSANAKWVHLSLCLRAKSAIISIFHLWKDSLLAKAWQLCWCNPVSVGLIPDTGREDQCSYEVLRKCGVQMTSKLWIWHRQGTYQTPYSLILIPISISHFNVGLSAMIPSRLTVGFASPLVAGLDHKK